MKIYKISKHKKAELEERLRFLETVQKEQVEKFLSENKIAESWHQAASIEAHRNVYEKELNDLRRLLRSCEIIDEGDVDKSKIGVGVNVELRSNEKALNFKIVSSIEADPIKKMISLKSPIGKLLKGKKINDRIILPDTKEYIITRIN